MTMKALPRQLLLGGLREAVKVGLTDERWGRQLASTLEQHAMVLRLHVGGKPRWRIAENAENHANKPARATIIYRGVLLAAENVQGPYTRDWDGSPGSTLRLKGK